MHIANRGGFKLWMMSEPMNEMVDWLRDELPPKRRIAIAGTANEWFDWGTAAYLPILTGHEMLADDYYGFPRGLIARNFPPHPYNKTYEGWLDFERIYNISYWLAAEGSFRGKRAITLFDQHPEHFQIARGFGVQEGEHTELIAVEPGGNKTVEIGYRPSWQPLKPGWGGLFHH